MEVIITIGLFVALALMIVVPFAVGRTVESAWIGIIAISIPSVLFAIIGFYAYLSDRNSPNKEARDWADVWLALPMMALVAELAVLGIWGLGRVTRPKNDELPIYAHPVVPSDLFPLAPVAPPDGGPVIDGEQERPASLGPAEAPADDSRAGSTSPGGNEHARGGHHAMRPA